MGRRPDVTMRVVRAIVASMYQSGLDTARLLEACGLTAGQISDPDARVPHDRFLDFWRRAEAESPDIGLRTASLMNSEIANYVSRTNEFPLMRVALCRATLGEALTSWARYYAIHDAAALVSAVADDEQVRFVITTPLSCQPPRAYIDYGLCIVLRTVACAATRPVTAREVRFMYPVPASTAAYEAAFLGAPIRFAAEDSSFSFDRRDAATPLRTASPETLPEVERLCEDLLATVLRGHTLTARARQTISAELAASGSVRADVVAERLGMSVRTLTRRLRDEGTSHRALTDELRAIDARRRLLQGEAVETVAERLGFSEPSAFNRAFKRWFGMPPSALRKDAK